MSGTTVTGINGAPNWVWIDSRVSAVGEGALRGSAVAHIEFSQNATLTAIGNCAFGACPVLQIRIPASVKSIGRESFRGCDRLREVEFASGSQLTTIGARAFDGCAVLREISVPAGVEEIPVLCFRGSGLSKVRFGGKLRRICAGAFARCESLRMVDIPDSVEVIGAFAGQINLTTAAQVQIDGTALDDAPECVGAFQGCGQLERVYFGIVPGLREVGERSFAGCDRLAQWGGGGLFDPDDLPQLQLIGAGAFRDCCALEMLPKVESVTQIGEAAFAGCSALPQSQLRLSGKLRLIGPRAFLNCRSLGPEFVLPTDSELTTVGDEAFAGCDALVRFCRRSPGPLTVGARVWPPTCSAKIGSG